MKTKKCSMCRTTKKLNLFNFKNKIKNIRQSYCKECNKIVRKKSYENNRNYYLNKAKIRNQRLLEECREFIYNYLKTHSCVDCKEDNPIVLDFDHKPEYNKRECVSVLATTGYSLVTIKEEIAKCEVRCANCHRIKTAKDKKYFRYLQSLKE